MLVHEAVDHEDDLPDLRGVLQVLYPDGDLAGIPLERFTLSFSERYYITQNSWMGPQHGTCKTRHSTDGTTPLEGVQRRDPG